MISVTRMNGQKLLINALLIETIEAIPDTLITLSTGKKIIVLEEMSLVRSLVMQFVEEAGLLQATIKSQQAEGS